MKTRKILASACGLLLLSAAGSVAAQADPDWPCIQRLVPKMSAAMVWAGPDVAGADWQADEQVADLAHRITTPGMDLEQAEAAIESFATGLSGPERNARLSLLFAGVLDLLNQDRGKLIAGIKRFARGQSERADNLSGLLDEMVRLEDDASAAAQQRLARINQEIELRQRMFDEREKSIEYLCNRPVVVEQKLGRLARSIASWLD